MTGFSSNTVAMKIAKANGTLCVRAVYNERLNITFWAISDEHGVIEVCMSDAEAAQLVSSIDCDKTKEFGGFKIGDRVVAVNWHGEQAFGNMGEGIIEDFYETTEFGKKIICADCWWSGIDQNGGWQLELLRLA